MKLIKNNFRLAGIQPPPVLLDCLSALLSNKGALLLNRKALFGEQFYSFLSFFVMKYLITNQNICKSKLKLFHEVSFLKSMFIYINKVTLQIIDIFY